MPIRRDRLHILLPDIAKTQGYRPPLRVIPAKPLPKWDRQAHARALMQSLEKAEKESELRRKDAAAKGLTVLGAPTGLYVRVEGAPDFPLELKSLQVPSQNIEIMSVDPLVKGKTPERAVILVPHGSVGHFLKRFEAYRTKETKAGNPRHQKLVDSIGALELATLRALWTDVTNLYPATDDQEIWWELWLRAHDGKEIERLTAYAQKAGLRLGERRLTFPDRIVILAYGSPRVLSASIDVLDDLAEVRRAKELGLGFFRMGPIEVAEWVTELAGRIEPAPPEAGAVTVLDTGANRGHPLLEPSLAEVDTHACDPAWGKHDHDGHGTEMSGIALLGDLRAPLLAAGPVRLTHCLESVKILPPPEQAETPPDLYGARTAEAVSRVEIQAPDRRRAFALAVTSDSRDRGQPTSWSAAVDALAAGRSFDTTTQGLVYLADAEERAKRLFVVSAGNVDDLGLKHLDRSDVEPIEDPGQAWNALTVGAYTTKVHIDPTDPTLNGWSPLAQDGELSPYSKTSVLFEPQWPVKPDVVLEGGNRGYEEGSNHAVQVDCLSLLTTNANMAQGLVTPTWGTSPAAAEGARLAMQIAHRYPSYWPETIRGLIAHSADWTPVMRGNLPKGAGRKAKLALLRRYGYGVPSLERALKSATNSLTLIAQARIRPFAEGKFREIRFYDLPWPKEVLFDLGKETVKMRVTLSYFIEPNPGRRGWRLKHRYASHGLRFDVKGPQESIDTFEKRLNDLALAEEEDQPKAQHDDLWYFGADARKKGSLHSDIWEGTAADLATSGVIAVVPTSGWWKDQPARDRSGLGARYALLVSIETAAEDVDIYTPVATELQIPIDVQIET